MLYVPEAMRRATLEAAHEERGHAGEAEMARWVGERFYWPAWRRDVRAYAAACHECALQRVHRARLPNGAPRRDAREPGEAATLDVLTFGAAPAGLPAQPSALVYKSMLLAVDHATDMVKATNRKIIVLKK